jgi:DNA-binding NtrC family response regulator
MERITQSTASEMRLPPFKVLIFDEDVIHLAEHAHPFEAHRLEVHKCTSREAAMRAVEREDFDLALVDQCSPHFEGSLLIRHLIRYNPCTPFIVLAQCEDMNCYLKALELGASDYIHKPVPFEEMSRIIRNYLGIPVSK